MKGWRDGLNRLGRRRYCVCVGGDGTFLKGDGRFQRKECNDAVLVMHGAEVCIV